MCCGGKNTLSHKITPQCLLFYSCFLFFSLFSLGVSMMFHILLFIFLLYSFVLLLARKSFLVPSSGADFLGVTRRTSYTKTLSREEGRKGRRERATSRPSYSFKFMAPSRHISFRGHTLSPFKETCCKPLPEEGKASEGNGLLVLHDKPIVT